MAEVIAITKDVGNEVTLEAAMHGFLASVDLADSTIAVYRATLWALVDELESHTPVTKVGKATIERHLREKYGSAAPATFNRNLATIASLFAWAEENELVVRSPARAIRRRRNKVSIEAERQARPIPIADLEALWTNHRKHSLRDRSFWAMAYDTAARADELLGLNIENIDQVNREAVITGKGGNTERLYWSSTTARLLPRLINGRTSGPLFIGDRKPRSHLAPAAADLCPTTRRARLSYRRAEEIWKQASNGSTLHQLRHSRLTHLAEAGEDITMIKAKSRHRSLRSLERYVAPSPTAIRDLTNRHDPNRR